MMSIYWFFDLTQVARRIGYLDSIGNTETYTGLSAAIEAYRETLPSIRSATGIPL